MSLQCLGWTVGWTGSYPSASELRLIVEAPHVPRRYSQATLHMPACRWKGRFKYIVRRCGTRRQFRPSLWKWMLAILERSKSRNQLLRVVGSVDIGIGSLWPPYLSRKGSGYYLKLLDNFFCNSFHRSNSFSAEGIASTRSLAV